MAGIANAVGEKVAEDISTNAVNFLMRHAGYLISCGDNVKMLGDCNKKLQDKRDEAHKFIMDAQQNFKEAVPSVVRWQDEAEVLNKHVVAFLNKEAEGRNPICQTPWSRYSMGRKAFKMAECVNAKLSEAPAIDKLAYDVAPSNPGSTFNLGAIKDYGSRLSLMDEVLKALSDDKLSIIGLCGIGGVGKTTVAKQLVNHVETQKLFKVAFTTVSQKPDLEKVQSDIVSCLGLKFIEGETEHNRKSKLHRKITESDERIFLVLDDVWPTINFRDFEAIGIPTESQRCKILLTSRREITCNALGSQKNFQIATLSREEGFDLFKKMVGDLSDGDLVKIGESIAHECGGMPIAIVTVANALRNKAEKTIWEYVLLQLQNHNPQEIFEMEEKVHLPIKLSYSLLQTEKAKSCFLLCSLFPEDLNISIEQLTIYSRGLGFLGETSDFQQARNAMQYLIYQLKDSFLLLDGDRVHDDDDDFDECIKMHDVVCDVAISIASKGNPKYMVLHDIIMKKCPDTDCVGISIKCEDMKEHPTGLEYPNLQVLLLEYVNKPQFLPDNFFEGMKELKVLSVDMLQSLPDSLDLLKNLTTLCLLNFYGKDISLIGALTNLDVLEIGGTGVITLPLELANLENLRFFDIRGLKSLEYIPQGILSKLARLEEFYVSGPFTEWDNKSNASLSELESCPITALEICVAELSQIPSINTQQIRKFHITVGYDYVGWERGRGSMNKMHFKGHKMLTGYSKRSCEIKALLRRSEILTLRDVEGFQHIINEQQEDGFPELKTLRILNSTVEQLVDTNSRNLQLQRKGVTELPCFSNLRDIRLLFVKKLENMFPLSMAKHLKQLERIQIRNCYALRGIFCRKGVDDENVTDTEIEFPKLTKLQLFGLIKLIGFWVEMEIKEDESLPCQSYNMEQASTSEIEQLHSNSSPEMAYAFFPSSWLRFSSLQELILVKCNDLKVAFPASVAQQLLQLKHLWVRECKKMEYIVGRGKEENKLEGTTISPLPMLISLNLHSMDELDVFSLDSHTSSHKMKEGSLMLNEGFSHGNTEALYCAFTSKVIGGTQFENLTLVGCAKLQVIFSFMGYDHASGVFNSLKTLQLEVLENLQHIWLMKIPPEISSFRNLQTIKLLVCDNLQYVFSPHMAKVLVNLEKLCILTCKKMTAIVAAEEQVFEILFPKLRFMLLGVLPEVRCFSGGASYNLEFPLLEKLRLRSICMPSFCNGSVSTPRLKEITLGVNDIYPLKEDLNATLKGLEEKMLATLEENPDDLDDSYDSCYFL